MDASGVLLVAVVVIGGIAVLNALVTLGLVRQVYELRAGGSARYEGSVPLGSRIPDFTGVDVFGTSVNSEALVGKTKLLLFVSTGCSDCTATLNELHALDVKSEGRLALVCRGSTADCRSFVEGYDVPYPVVVDGDMLIARKFGIDAFPTAVMLDPEGVITSRGVPQRSALELAAAS